MIVAISKFHIADDTFYDFVISETNPAMAVVLEALASYIQNMLTEMAMEMAKKEVRMLLGIPDELNKMSVKLRDLKRFLADADKRNISDETVQGWVKEFRFTMYDASDILDSCQLKAMKRGPSRDMGCFNPFLLCLRNPLHAHGMGIRLRKLNEKLIDIETRSNAFNFLINSNEDNGRIRNIESTRLARRETTGELDKLDLVGDKVEEDTRYLVELLTRDEKTIHEHKKGMVFAIVGVGGIGKTTLAKSIFNNEIIQQKFNKKIWLSVNQDFNDLDLLERAITEAGGDHQAARNTKAALVRTLNEALKECKTLLVMDDVWDHQAWECVLKDPFTNVLAPGSRVLITTRHNMVARGMRAEMPYHHVNKLDPEEAWSLLKKQVCASSLSYSL
jgi:hypothetical protein